MAKNSHKPPLVAHIVYCLDFGGLENGLVNLVNAMPNEVARHAIISLTTPGEIVSRITKKSVTVYNLSKSPGKDFNAYLRLFRLLRKIRPDIVHTRNYGTIDCQFVAYLAGVPRRVHGEHGWDVHDPHGQVKKYQYLRRMISPFVHKFIALSEELQKWLTGVVGIPEEKIERICNGVDTERIYPRHLPRECENQLVFGSVTRFNEIKDPLNTIRSFIHLSYLRPTLDLSTRLVMVGDGPLMEAAKQLVAESGIEDRICLVGRQLDVVRWLEKMDVFVMGSKREGISNTILEAMAAGLPVIATNVGGNSELIEPGKTGSIVPAESSGSLAKAMQIYIDDAGLIASQGKAARERVEAYFSLDNMVEKYSQIYSPTKSIQSRVA